MNLKKLMERKGCVTADGSTAISRPNTPNYFLWCYLKQVVYSNHPQTIDDLKQNTEAAISNIPPPPKKKTLKKVVRNMVTNVDTCLSENGGHFQH
jgi:hypothetical protein